MGLLELLLITLLVLLVFGANRLPELGRGLGKAVRGLREASDNQKKSRGKLKTDD